MDSKIKKKKVLAKICPLKLTKIKWNFLILFSVRVFQKDECRCFGKIFRFSWPIVTFSMYFYRKLGILMSLSHCIIKNGLEKICNLLPISLSLSFPLPQIFYWHDGNRPWVPTSIPITIFFLFLLNQKSMCSVWTRDNITPR